MNQPRHRVLVTGSTGSIGTILMQGLAEEFKMIGHARSPEDAPARENLRFADITDLEATRGALRGIQTVVHLAAAAEPDSTWEQVLEANIIGMRNVLEAARLEGVRRVVIASSNHVMGGHDRAGTWPLTEKTVPRPDSLYGVSKAFAESLGSFYHDEYDLDVICLRIGWVAADPSAEGPDAELLQSLWLSPGDAVRVVRCAITAPVRWGVYAAISANPNARWSLANTRIDLGYRPQDSWDRFLGVEETVIPGGAPVRADWPRR